jgi:uncharacterized damage-inducible protein DinB
MFTTADLKAFHAAAHSSLDVLLAHLATMDADLLVTELPGFARPNIRDQMFHTIACEIFWIHGLQLLPMPKLRADDYMTAQSLAQFKRRAMAETIEYLDHQTEEELNQVLPRVSERWVGTSAQPRIHPASCADARLSPQRPSGGDVPPLGPSRPRYRLSARLAAA